MSTASIAPSSTDTPMLRQYKAIKADHMDAILFFRLGDFYEMFLDDAILAAKELELTLTGRGKDEHRIPMCGVPYHAADNYIPRLIHKGYKVAICEQVEDPTETKGITRREVTKIITPGTLMDQGHLDEKSNNFLVAICPIPKSDTFGVSAIDISTGEFKLDIATSMTSLVSFIEKLSPKEVIIPDSHDIELGQTVFKNAMAFHDVKRAEELLKEHFKIQSLSAFGIQPLSGAFPAAWAVLNYTKQTQKTVMEQINSLLPMNNQERLFLDRATIRNLELITPLHPDQKNATLFAVLDDTKTSMGARALKQRLVQPYTNVDTIKQQLDSVEALKKDILSREEIRDILDMVYDIERLTSRIAAGMNNPRDAIALKNSLEALRDLPTILNQLDTPLLNTIRSYFTTFSDEESPFSEVITLINDAIVTDPPNSIKDGNVIKAGFNVELDQLLDSFKSIKNWIGGLEEEERQSTGIKTLKVGYNKVFGYYFEISNSYKNQVPEHYIRKQTLTNAERYITPELKENETVLLNGEDKQRKLEIDIYDNVVQALKHFIPDLQHLARQIAELDIIQSLASVAQRGNYTKPNVSDSDDLVLYLKNSRHPVIEKNTDTPFIPNTISMSKDEHRFMLITGPNMAGKSTIMRQIALSIVMAQIGSFIPADDAKISVTDKLFTRIGALDNLYYGQSTFMVEMLETATIINNATERSIIILDEIGRGTATFDGMSIACAVTEHIHNDIGARTLFATHYHELTILDTEYPELSNFNMQITEHNGKLIFQHKLIPGPADKSYGIHVGKMAGLPDSVIKNAEKHLQGFEHHGADYLKERVRDQLSLF